MTTTVARRYRFQAEHHVPGLAAPWCEPHDHDYTVEVVAGSHPGRVLDTDLLDRVWDDDVAALDGSYLNEHLDDTTVEALSEWLLRVFREQVPAVMAVTVWEDDDRWGRTAA